MANPLPALELTGWKTTRDTLHLFSRILGKIRSRYSETSKHWWHITLSVSARGLTTTPFPIAGQQLELTLDLAAHRFVTDSSEGWSTALPLQEQTAAAFCRRLEATLAAEGIDLPPNLLDAFHSEEPLAYDAEAVIRFRRVITWVDAAFKRFKNGLREETSPVQLFPHHMDLAVNWFSGRQVQGTDPADAENADEQMNFGFVTGDDAIPDACFYAIAYPAPDGWTNLTLPGGAHWPTEGWTGAVLPYETLVRPDRPLAALLGFLGSVQAHGAKSMP